MRTESLPRMPSSAALTVMLPFQIFRSFLQTMPSSVLPLTISVPLPFSFRSSREKIAPLTGLVLPSLST